VLDGSFEAETESYVTDQFVLRDGWMGLKAWCERLLGKRENNGVFICGDTLIERMEQPDSERLSANADYINRFAESVDVPVCWTILPTAQEIWKDRLPFGAPRVDEEAVIASLKEQVEIPFIDTLSALREHADEAIYYRTDHHWTSLGAYYGAQALTEALGCGKTALVDYTARTVTEDFFGTLYSKSGAHYISPDTIELYASDDGVTVTRVENGTESPGLLYDWDQLAEKDKYSLFLGGNQPLAVVKTGHEGKKLLMVRDSYADSEVPFLLPFFSEIHLFDLRYVRGGLIDYIAENGIDCVVVSYSLRNFATDGNLYFLLK